MVVPASAFKFDAEMDPAELLDYQLKLSEGPLKLLEDGELFTTWTLTLYPEAIALGVELGSGTYEPVADGENITVWFQVDPLFQEDAAFDGNGVDVPMELSITTNHAPARKRQRTLVLPMRQL